MVPVTFKNPAKVEVAPVAPWIVVVAEPPCEMEKTVEEALAKL